MTRRCPASHQNQHSQFKLQKRPSPTASHGQDIQKRNHILRPHHQKRTRIRLFNIALSLLWHRISQLFFLIPQFPTTMETWWRICRGDGAEGAGVWRVVSFHSLDFDFLLYNPALSCVDGIHILFRSMQDPPKWMRLTIRDGVRLIVVYGCG